MARCGRCGLWNKYPEDHHEKKWAGTCLWFQHRLVDDEVFRERECPEFFEKIPGTTSLDHLDYKLRRDEAGRRFRLDRRAFWISIVALLFSLFSLVK